MRVLVGLLSSHAKADGVVGAAAAAIQARPSGARGPFTRMQNTHPSPSPSQNLAAGCDANKVAVVAAGGLALLLDILETHAQSVKPVQHALGALQNLAFDSISADAILPRGVSLTVAAMRTHDAVAPVAEHACGLLLYLTAGSRERRKAVFRGGVAPAVVDALLRHGAESRATAYKAAGVVLNLVEDEDAAEVQVRGGGLWGV